MNTSISAETESARAGSAGPGGDGPSASSASKSNGVPVLPVADPAAESSASAAVVRALREFHFAGEDLDAKDWPAAGVLPALMTSFRDVDKIRYDFPLFLYPPTATGELCEALPEWLDALVLEFAPGENDAAVLKDNLERLERLVRKGLDGKSTAVDAREILVAAGATLQADLGLAGDAGAKLASGIEELCARVPAGGQLLGYRDETTIHLIVVAARAVGQQRRTDFLAKLAGIRRRLKDVLAADRAKDPAAREPDALVRSMGNAALLRIDPAAMSEMIGPHRGAPQMATDRRERIISALATIDAHVARAATQPLVVVLHDGQPGGDLAELAELELIQDDYPCAAAAAIFDSNAGAMAELFRAVRIAELELAERYDHDVYGPWLAKLDWETFSADEIGLVPALVTLESAERVIKDGLVFLSRLVRSGRPVKVLVTTQPAANPDAVSEGDPTAGLRFEIGYFGISHREAVVHQSTPARPRHMLEGLRLSLATPRPAIHIVDLGVDVAGKQPALGGWLYSGAAVEGRAQPLFRYDPDGGESWAKRFDFSGNPQIGDDWPTSQLAFRKESGEVDSMELAFTFADFALLDSTYRSHFRPVPADCPRHVLVAVDAYLKLPQDEAARLIPCVWAVDASGRLMQMAISRRLAFACRDRIGFWHTLQELAGVHSEYVETAVAAVREEISAAAAAERAAAEAAHAEAIVKAREEAGGDAMQRLAAVLMDADLSAVSGAPAAAPAAAAPAAAEAAPAAAAEVVAVVEEEEDAGFDDAWIDAPLCTSCNDCINANPQLFVYNDSKQAMIGDVSAGTFAQLVELAEKCPSRCIHPGKPQNPNEPGLDELILRAAPLN